MSILRGGTTGLGGGKVRPRKYIRVGKGALRHHKEIKHLSYEEWRRYCDPSGNMVSYQSYLNGFYSQ